MCELFGLNSNTPEDIKFSFKEFKQRGGLTSHHSDGWGTAFLKDNTCQLIKEPSASAFSLMADLLCHINNESKNIISHIRLANYGKVSLANTHPFLYQMGDTLWAYAHNGILRDIHKNLPLKRLKPLGTTDSEHAFYWIMEQIEDERGDYGDINTLFHKLCLHVNNYGIFNIIIAHNDSMFCYCADNLHYLARNSAPEETSNVSLTDIDFTVHMSTIHKKDDKVTLVATNPLTTEPWVKMKSRTSISIEQGSITTMRG